MAALHRLLRAACGFLATSSVAFALSAADTTGARATRSAERAPVPRVLRAGSEMSGLLYAPRPLAAAKKPVPVAVMLHGMCDEPQYECPYFVGATQTPRWLLCPRASMRCEGGGSIWSFRDFQRTVEASVHHAKRLHPHSLDDSQRILIGFSLGAIRGIDVLHEGAGRYQGGILIGAKFYPSASQLRAAGVKRLVLMSGDYDMMKWHMVQQARKLAYQRYPVAFMSTGKIGHWFPRDFPTHLERAMAWIDGDDAAFRPKRLGELAFVPRAPNPRAGLGTASP